VNKRWRLDQILGWNAVA